MNQQAFDIASSLLPQMQDDGFALSGVGDVAHDDIESVNFASQLQTLTQPGGVQPDARLREVKSKDLSTSLFLEPEGAQPINDLSDAYKHADASMPQQTISTSTWQAWLEQQVSAAGAEAYPRQQSAKFETDMDQARGATEEGLSPLPSPPSPSATTQWKQTQSALLREEPVAQDSASTRASASSDTTTGTLEAEQQQLFASTSTDKQADALRLRVANLSPAEGRITSKDSVPANFAEPTATSLASTERQTDDAVLPNVGTDPLQYNVQIPSSTFGDAPSPDKDADALPQGPQKDWDLAAQTKLAQALPAQASASATLEATFADKLSDFAMSAPQGDESPEPVVTSGRAIELTRAPQQDDFNVSKETSGVMVPAKAQFKQPDAMVGANNDRNTEAADADTQAASEDIEESATALSRTAPTKEDVRLKKAEDLVPVERHDDADAQRGVIAAHLTAAPPTMGSESAASRADTAKTSQKVSQGLEAYNSQARQRRPDADERSSSADAAGAMQAPADATGKAAPKGKSLAGFTTNMAEAADADRQSPTAASHPEAEVAAATRAQSSDGLAVSEGRVTSLGAAEGAQAAAMTATVTPSRLSAQLAANLSDGARRIQLRVAPPGLGTLDIGVHLQGAQVHLTVRGDQPELTRFMQEGMSDLQKNLQQHGLDLGNTDFRGGEGSAEADEKSPRGNLPQNSKAAPPQGRASTSAPRARDAHVINVLF